MDYSDSECEAEEIEMAEEQIVENVNFEKKFNFDLRNFRSGFSFLVVPFSFSVTKINVEKRPKFGYPRLFLIMET